MTRALALLAAASLLAGASTACKLRRYDVKVRFTPEATDRRLARGQADTIKGRFDRVDGQNVYLTSGDMSEPIPVSEIAEVDQHMAKRDVRYGVIFGVAGVIVSGASLFFFECGQGDFVLACPFQSEQNLVAGLAFLGGATLAIKGANAYVSGKHDQSRNAELLHRAGVRTSSWWITPAPVAANGGAAPGFAAGARF